MSYSDEDSDDGDFYGENEDDEEEPQQVTLVPCGNCGRNFNTDVLPRHQKICTNLKKRKAFDSSKQRLEGVEVKPQKKASKETLQTKKKSDWRRKHEEFVKTIRAARGTTAAIKAGKALPPVEPSYNPDYIQCEFCNRRFNESAAERHINFCKEQKSRLPKQSTDSKNDQKKEKQNKRTQYRPPLPGSKKKSIEHTPATKRMSSGSSPSTKINKMTNGYSREGSSDSNASSKLKKQSQARSDDRPLSNSRYSKTYRVSSGSSDNDSVKSKSAKNRNGDPKWFEDLKRGDSGNSNKLRKANSKTIDIDELDSGMDSNENLPDKVKRNSSNRYSKNVGVVHPSSRIKDNDGFSEDTLRKVNSGRRKMATFCHDCGTKYPIPSAKFCCECGMKRMALT